MASSYSSVSLDDFEKVLGSTSTEISSVALGGRVISYSDEWFAPASSLLKVGPAASLRGQFSPKGALFDGWETRRHNPTYDWVIIRLGPKSGGQIVGFDVDTAVFNGNEAPEVEVYALTLTAQEEDNIGDKLAENDPRWETLIPTVPCGPSQRHLFALDATKSTKTYTHVKLHMIPDGGIARFRVYGVIPPPPLGQGQGETVAEKPELNSLDLAHCLNGGRVVFTDDQHFGAGRNIILPGRGKDMGDGWETRRSRAKGHFNWTIIKLGEAGYLSYAEIDTAHFLGNFPESVELVATNFDGQIPPESVEWTSILARSKTGPGRRHFFQLTNVDRPYTHVMVKMLPDGGIKRVRLVGRRAALLGTLSLPLPTLALPADVQDPLPSAKSDPFAPVSDLSKNGVGSVIVDGGKSSGGSDRSCSISDLGIVVHGDKVLAAQPPTTTTFAPYGNVIASPPLAENAPFKIVNQGTAKKYLTLAPVINNYPVTASANTNIHVFYCDPVDPIVNMPFQVKLLERHRFTTQAFVPMTSNDSQGQQGYLVVVALNGVDDKPDMNTIAVFYATTEQGISYHPGIWHHPMIALGTIPTGFVCIVNESSIDCLLNCDEVQV